MKHLKIYEDYHYEYSHIDNGIKSTRNPLAFQILRKAVISKFITLEDANVLSIRSVAEEIADEHNDDEEIGSSDMTFILKEFLDGIGFQTDFVDDKLVVKGKHK